MKEVRRKFSKQFWAELFVKPRNDKIRFDIQALRALAVIAVVIYHIWPNRLPGGFMGVDVFFVISGYLMTLTIWKSIQEIKKTKVKKFSESIKFLFGFYARRIKRLAPAATVCLLAVLVAIYVLGNFGVQQLTAPQVLKSAIFLQNWHLAGEAVDYLGADSGATAVQHFWSLSIEEQFYMIWPLLLLICGLIGRLMVARSKRKLDKWGGVNLPLIVLSLLALATFIYGYWLTKNNSAAAYFVTPARIWELVLGGVIAFLPVLKNRDLRLLLPWLGLAMCMYAIVRWNGVGFPGWHALVPTMGTALIIYAGGQKLKKGDKFFIDNIAKFRPAQFFGDISYSLYLWHWPLIILIPLFLNVDFTQNRWLKIVICIISIAIAWLSYRFIEMPPRKWRPQNWKVWLFGVMCLAVIVTPAYFMEVRAMDHINNAVPKAFERAMNPDDICFGARAVQHQDKCGNPFGRMDKTWIQFAETSFMTTRVTNESCSNGSNSPVDQYCEFGDTQANKTMLLLGDSYSQQWYSTFDVVGQQLGYKVIGANSIMCGSGLIELDEYFYGVTKLQRDIKNCNKRFRWTRDNLWSEADTIVIAASPYYFSGDNNSVETKQDAVQKIAETINSIYFQTGKIPILMQSIPAPLYDGSLSEEEQKSCITRNCVMDIGSQRKNSLNVLRERILTMSPDITMDYLEVEDLFCDKQYCYSQIGGLPVYYNTGHINSFYAMSAAERLNERLRVIENVGR